MLSAATLPAGIDRSPASSFASGSRFSSPVGPSVTPTAVARAEDFGHSVDREIGYLVAHGVLHLLGYDHEEVEDRRRMRHREEEALRPLGFTR